MQPQRPSSLDNYLDGLKAYLSDQRISYTIESIKRSLRDMYSTYDSVTTTLTTSLYWWFKKDGNPPIAYDPQIMDDKDEIDWAPLLEQDKDDERKENKI